MRWLCGFSKGSQQAEEMGLQKSHGVQQREVPSPAPGEEQPQAPEQGWGPTGWKRA